MQDLRPVEESQTPGDDADARVVEWLDEAAERSRRHNRVRIEEHDLVPPCPRGPPVASPCETEIAGWGDDGCATRSRDSFDLVAVGAVVDDDDLPIGLVRPYRGDACEQAGARAVRDHHH